ncbi:MAG TPA: hypothetical protein VLS49_16125 [Usitatibacter sp.]|nr:hypothetical protein [Usitatibacter sp.]
MDRSIKYVRLVPDSSGESHFVPLEIDVTMRSFAPPAPPFGVSEPMPASQCGFLVVPPGFLGELHPSPTRMWIFFLRGEMDFEASDGERRRCVPGDAILLEDTTGKGHSSRVIGESPAVLAAVRL